MKLGCAQLAKHCFMLVLLDVDNFYDSALLYHVILIAQELGDSPYTVVAQHVHLLGCQSHQPRRVLLTRGGCLGCSVVPGFGEANNLARTMTYGIVERYNEQFNTEPARSFGDDLA